MTEPVMQAAQAALAPDHPGGGGLAVPPARSGGDGNPFVAWTIAGAAGLLGVAALTVQLASGVPLTSGDLLFVVVDAMVALVYGAVAGLVLA